MRRATYCGHRSAVVNPGIAVARYSEWADHIQQAAREDVVDRLAAVKPGVSDLCFSRLVTR